MNYFNAYFNPMDAITQGYDLGDKFTRTQREAQAMRDDEAMRQGYAALGQGEQMTGYDDVPEAKRPDFLKRLFASNPRAAMEMEQSLAAPYALKRDIAKAGKIEEMKKRADLETNLEFARRTGFMPEGGMPGETGAPQNAFANYLQPPAEDTTVAGLPPGPWNLPEQPAQAAPMNAAMMPPAGRSPNALDARERSMTLGPNGMSFNVKNPSALDVAGKVADIKSKEGTLGVAERNLTRQEQADKAEQEHKQREYNRQLARDRDEEVNRITEHIRQNKQAIRDANKLPPDQAEQEVAALKTENRQLEQRRNGLLKGTIKPEAKTTQSAPAAMPQAPSIMPSRSAPATPAAPTASSAPAPAPAAPAAASAPAPAPIQAAPAETPISKNQEMEIEQKNREQQITLANKEVADARNAAQESESYWPVAKDILDLVFSDDIGNPKVAEIPGGEQALRFFSPKYAELNKLRDAFTRMLIKPGQSQLANTLPELKMLSSSVASADSTPELNRKNAVRSMNLVERIQQYPNFLEAWGRTHHGTLEGSAEAWREYGKFNDKYLYDPGKGRSGLSENRAFMPVSKWLSYKEMGLLKVGKDAKGRDVILMQTKD